MGKITKPLQPKHKDTLSPWLKDFVQAAVSTPLPLIPKKLEEFPTRWPFPRGDLYHWIPLLNRFDNILECLSRVYGLADGPQSRDFQCDILLKKVPEVEYQHDRAWSMQQLQELGYKEDGDLRLLVAILDFTCMLLQHCGNRSIYASSSHLNDLLQSTSLHVLIAALQVGHQLAQRYQASVKRVSVATRQLSMALLANHYNIDLDRVQTLAQPFVKTPIVNFTADPFPATPGTSAAKGKDKVPVVAAKNVATTTANDLVSVTQDQPEDGRWSGWGDVKVHYYTTPAPGQDSSISQPADRSSSSTPSTPTPLRRSNTAGPQHRTPRGERSDGLGDEASSPASQGRSPAVGADSASSTQQQVTFPQNAVANTSIYDLLSRCPSDMPNSARYEVLNRLRISKALLGTPETRQLALAVRLLAITNMAYIHPEAQFIEKALKCDNDEPRRYQLTYQLVELIHPSTVGASPTPQWLQAIALQLLEGICAYATKYTDVLSALNANVNHGVLLYVIRKAVAEMKEDTGDNGNRHTEDDEWRSSLFSLALNMAQTGRAGGDSISSGMMEIMVEILKLRSSTAQRHQPMVLSFLDNVTWAYPGAFQAFVTADGLTGVSQLIIDTTAIATTLTEQGKGTSATAQSVVVDYEIPYYQQQTLKWLLKFSHHIMTNSFTYGGNIDRLLRNLVDNSQLLQSLRTIVQHVTRFGSVVWTHAVSILGDFINNDPTSFNAILESGTIHTFLESLTGQKVVMEQPKEPEATQAAEAENPEESPSSPRSDGSVVLEDDERSHPPTKEELNAPRTGPLARGILPSAEAMSIIPNILNALSLNNTGMTMVAKSRVFDTYLEIFESPAHVRCMLADAEIPSNIGATFDELARHHPALRTALSNAVLDLVAKIKHLGETKAASSGWGMKLRLAQDGSSSQAKGKANAGEDIDMIDAEPAPGSDAAPANNNVATTDEADVDGIKPYVTVLLNFLHAFVGNSNLKSAFVANGGLELILDLCQSPSWSFDFLDSAAARTMEAVVSQLVEQAPVLGLPSLLNRTQAAVEALQPLLSTAKGDSYLAPFVQSRDSGSPDELSDVARSKHAEATRVAQGLLHTQSFLKLLWHTFPTPARPGHSGLHPVNVFDYYIRLVKTLGPLLPVILVEADQVTQNVPRHWAKKPSTSQDRANEPEAAAPSSNAPAASLGDAALQDVLQLAPGSGSEAELGQTKKVTPQEQSSEAYRNFQTLNGLLRTFMSTIIPVVRTLGKVVLPRRDRDPYVRSRHLQIADALAEVMFDHLLVREAPKLDDYQSLLNKIHVIYSMLIDHPKGGSSAAHIIVPVLLAFKERGGLDALNKLLLAITSHINKDPSDGDDDARSKFATMSAKKILDLYAIIVNGKNISTSNDHVTMHRSADRGDSAKFIPQLVLELRMAILPTVRGIWASSTVEQLSASILGKVVEILRTIAAADLESGAMRKSDSGPPPTLFKLQSTPFNWSGFSPVVKQLSDLNNDEQLSREATYRALGERERAMEYSRAHGPRHLAGARNPIPEEDAYKDPPQSENASRNEASAVPSDAMVVDSAPDLDRLLGEAVLGELDHSDSDDDDDEDQAAEEAEVSITQPIVPTEPAAQPAEQSSAVENKDNKSYVYREDLDEERAKIQEDLIDRCLDVIRAHPDSVYELSDLISTTVLKTASGDSRQEVGETLVNALMSFAIDEEVKKSSARSIAAYAHLLCILLQDSQPFFRVTISSLKDNIRETMEFLKLPPGNSSEELPPWLPYILLIFEILLTEDQQLPEATWKGPKSETDEVEPVILGSKDIIVSQEDRATLLETILDMLPRIGKDEMLAVAVLRILVILTRDRSVARSVGDKKNLQRLFVMAKQLSGVGSARFKETRIGANIMLILRHIVEDDDTIRQIMRYEIKSHFENPRSSSSRLNDLTTYLRATSHIALRAPDLFVAVTNDMVQFSAQWVPDLSDSGRSSLGLVLKESVSSTPTAPKPSKDDSVEPAVQGTEDLNINDVRPTTESVDKEMVDVPKTPAFEHKRPIVENPDGVINFLLEQLLNYQRVEDAEVPQQPKEDKSADESTVSTPAGPTATGAVPAAAEPAQSRDKDKKPSKPIFKAEEHPIFIYRCFLLSCLTELLQSYNRTKIEFINFKRGAILQTNTPVKPRSSVLNYLLNDLLCVSGLTSPADTIAAKKKAATAEQARFALAALVTKTSEKPIDRSKDRFEYDDEPDLLFVRKFVLDMILRAYKDAATSSEAFDVRYAKMLSIAELMNHMIGEKDRESSQSQRMPDSSNARSQMQLKRLMYEKGYLGALTTSIADIDLTFPGVKRTIKYILRVLRVLSSTAIYLSRSSVILTTSIEDPEDDVLSNSSLSDVSDDREETPDLYRNSALGMLEPQQDGYHDGSEDDDDEEMYEDEYDDEMDYGEAMSEDGEEDISDEDEELGEIEGLSGDPNVVEVIMGEDEDESMHDDDDEEDEDDEDSEDDDDDEDDEDEVGSEDMDVIEEQLDMIGAGGAEVLDDGWEDEASDDEADDGEGVDFEAVAQDLDEVRIHGGLGDGDLGRFENVVRAMGEGIDFEPDDEDIQRFEEHYLEEAGEEDEDEDDDNEIEDEEFIYDPRDGPPPAHMPPGLGWDDLVAADPGVGNHRHRHVRSPFPPFVFGRGDPMNDFRSFFGPRHGRGAPTPNAPDDGVNPLLRRGNASSGRDASPRSNGGLLRVGMPSGLFGANIDTPLAFLNDLVASMPNMPNMRHGDALHLQVTHQGPGGQIRELHIPYPGSQAPHPRTESRRELYQEPHQAVSFAAQSTYDRWLDEARMIYGATQPEKVVKALSNRIIALLTPAALELAREAKAIKEEREKQLREEREKLQEEDRKIREAKEAEEKAEREKKEAEEKERAEREAAEAAARAAEEAPAEAEPEAQEPQAMEGVETTGSGEQDQAQPAPAVEASERIMTTIRGEAIDVTDLGIDPDYLAALPEEFREEVITGTLTARRSEARAQADNAGDQSEILNEFLAALPEDMRMEIVQHERQENRRREREENQRANAASGQAALAQDMDAGSILATLDADLRNQILMEQGEDILDQLPPDMAAQAAAFQARHRPRPPPQVSRAAREAATRVPPPAAADNKVERRAVVQMLDKAGIATLLRLMFITQQGSIRNYLFSVFTDVCENRQNRIEVVSTLLQILQEGSTDMDAVERSFGQLSLKARQPREKEGKTPNSLKRTFTNISASASATPTSDISPLLIVQQCLDLLVELSTKNLHIPSLFLTEHEIVGSTLKRSFNKKGKGKDTKASKYAINSLLSLLDRALIMESSSVMQLLVDLLNKVTYPLQALERRRKEAIEEEKKEAEKKDEPATEPASAEQATTITASEAQSQVATQPEASASGENTTAETTTQAEAGSSTAAAEDAKAVEKKKARQLQPPVIPLQNLTLVVNIFVARECSSKTFQNTISTIKNLSNIPDAKQVFGQELVRQARQLSENIVSDLNELLPHILKAETGTEIQGIALAKFSPGASEQNKLLRVLTALDHLFDSKKKPDGTVEATENDADKFDFLSSLGYNSTFGVMWEKLSACLGAIRKRENMLNVATILLPLIESLMVVCKNTTSLSEVPAVQKDMVLASPAPEDRISGLFFSFTEEHRRILNELVRHNPKLMSGTFSLLVKNPKVLEFDNKRNYFNRSVHAKVNNQGRSSFPPLQLSVRRDQVFHDSFKSLYFKSGDEMKYGKLSIRFHGEEGVDAGGVSREWFQVLARQMFDPNYVLFIPVSSDRTTFHPNKLSAINDEHLMFFKFIGRVIGKALYEGRLLDSYFSRVVYKRILGRPVSVKDMESFDPDYYKSLVWMLENDITDIITETFSVEDDEFGVTTVVDLLPKGRDIAVTEDNKHEYVRLVVEHKLLTSVKEQMQHFLKGFHDVIPADLIAIFNEQELELLISGMPDIDIEDWKSTTEYHNYTAASPQIQWFWRAVRSFDKEERAKLLQFVTGTSKVPLNGFKELEGMNGVSRFNIHRDYGNKERLPSSHTCFNQLDLPEYESYDMLRGQLLQAITAGNDYFGFA